MADSKILKKHSARFATSFLFPRPSATAYGDHNHCFQPTRLLASLVAGTSMIADLDLQRFAEVLREYLVSYSSSSINMSPSGYNHAVTSVAEIEQALEEPGTAVFVYGDLGAGMFPMQHIARLHEEGHDASVNQRLGVAIREASANAAPRENGPARVSTDEGHGDNMISLSLRDGSPRNENIPVLIDEFDQVTSDEERRRFENLLREISERRSPIRFVLCGVSNSLHELLRAHESCYEYSGSPMPALSKPAGPVLPIGADRGVIESAAPHYAHIVPESLFCEMLNEPTFARNLR